MGRPNGPTVHWVAIARDGGGRGLAVVVCGRAIGAQEWSTRTARDLAAVTCGDCKSRSHLFAEVPKPRGNSWWKDCDDHPADETPNNGTGGLV